MRLTVADSILDVDPEAWDRLISGPSPFCEHAFLAALERSGSVGPGTGWIPLPVLVHQGAELVGAAPVWLKQHSMGEYIFDHAWAEGAWRAGIEYYPKLVVAAPFTPATGQRLLLAPGAGPEVAEALVLGLMELADRLDLSGVHWLFVTEAERDLLARLGLMPRLTLQYHWRNQGWADFEGFLGALSGKRRREIRRERRCVRGAGVEVTVLTGERMNERHWAAVDRFYRSTSARKWGEPYLSPAFFDELRRTFAHRVRFIAAEREGELVAGALAFQRGGALYGRYWGCDERLPQLHFETCFYRGIEHCIDQGLELFEAGAQGPHKLARGFLPVPIHSAHHLRHEGLAAAVGRFVEEERRHNEAVIEELGARSPYR